MLQLEIGQRLRAWASGVYLACGTLAVVIVDPQSRSIDVHDTNGTTSFSGNDRFAHPAMNGLADAFR